MSTAAYQAEWRKRTYLSGNGLVAINTGTVRRLQALTCLGWSTPRLNGLTDLPPNSLRALLWNAPRTVVTPRVRHAVADLYDQLCMTPAPARTTAERISVATARRVAKKHAWAPPLAWDDIDCDIEPWQEEESDVA